MESEKVKEIKKLIRYLADTYGTSKCLGKPNKELFADILTLINELEEENEKIKHISLNEEITVGEYLRGMQRLKDRVAELEEGIAKSMLGCEFLPECTNETLKQFTERLKDRLRYTSPTSDVLELSGLEFDGIEVEQCIDETLKEYEK